MTHDRVRLDYVYELIVLFCLAYSINMVARDRAWPRASVLFFGMGYVKPRRFVCADVHKHQNLQRLATICSSFLMK